VNVLSVAIGLTPARSEERKCPPGRHRRRARCFVTNSDREWYFYAWVDTVKNGGETTTFPDDTETEDKKKWNFQTCPLARYPAYDHTPVSVEAQTDLRFAPVAPTSAVTTTPRFFHRMSSNGTVGAPVYMFGFCRFLNLEDTEYPWLTHWKSGWVHIPEELLAPLSRDSEASHLDLFNIWLVSKDYSPISPQTGTSYSEDWPSLESWSRSSVPVAGVAPSESFRYFDQGRSGLLDRILEESRRRGVRVLMTVWGHSDLRHDPGGDWGTGWFSTSGWGNVGTIADFLEAASEDDPIWKFQKAYYRYLVGRYGGSSELGMWESVSEVAGLRGTDVSHTDRLNFAARVGGFIRGLDPYKRPMSSSSHGYTSVGQPHYFSGDYASTHAYDLLPTSGLGSNSNQTLFLSNTPSFRGDVLHVAKQLPEDMLTQPAKPWFHGEHGVVERDQTTGEPNVVGVSGTEATIVVGSGYVTGTTYFKGVTAFHYTMMSDLMRGASGTPLRWNDAKGFGEMRWRASEKSRPCPLFEALAYSADYFEELAGHRRIVSALIASKLAPWQAISGTGGHGEIPATGGTTGLFMRSTTTTACWLYRVVDGVPPVGDRQIDLTSYAPAGATKYDLKWINPWTGAELGAIPGVSDLEVNYWDGRMELVAPEGLDRRHSEDILLIIEGK